MSVDSLINRKLHLKEQYNRHRARKRLFVGILIPVVILLIGFAVACGSADIKFMDVYAAIFRKFFPLILGGTDAGHVDIIIWNLRLPRILMGVLAGIALGSTGAVMQVILCNPLADPYMLGISSAAGFGASLAIVLGVGIMDGPNMIIGNAFVFSCLSSGLILILSGRRGAGTETMILTGLALLFFFQAMMTIIQYFGNADAVKAAVFWAIGDLGKADWRKLSIAAPIICAGEALLIWKSCDLNIMNTGDAGAKSLGINVQRTRIFALSVCTFMVAAIVSFTGTIGFIGLVAPHIARMIIGIDNRILIPASGLIGAVLLVFSDTLARTIIPPIILPVGAVTAFLGVPLFVYLILKRNGDTA
ncbi:iron ABC transporter permease [uncultured Desulfobacter sp.]|uniref:FecCD family ABC transporter permease n=1 Tax=uncultured Desulfobacter sp. TaxID=240139 RepID=UPI0029F4A3BA|nr:iron ABC transporter permease [uncultured Desulfobacter sp.]